MKLGKRLKILNIKQIGAIIALISFVVVAIAGVVPTQEAVAADCSVQDSSCVAYSLGDVHAMGSLEMALAYQLFQIPLDDYDGEIKTLAVLLLAVFIGSGIFLRQRAGTTACQYWRATRHWHIKFWDHLHQAISRGIIHSKTLDCA